MTRPTPARTALALALLGAACTPAAPGAGPSPLPGDATTVATPAAPFPPIPLATGPLAPKVVYPPADHLIQARDSNFIFGSVGNGNATLTVNGAPVKVHPNGAWLGWLPVPPADAPRYELVVTSGADTARLSHPVRVLPPPAPAVAPPPPPDSTIPVARPDSAPRPAAAFAMPAVRERVFVQVGTPAPGDSDRTIVGRPTPAGTYKYFFTPGTVVELTGRQGAFARVRLDENLEVWVDSGDVRALPAAAGDAAGAVAVVSRPPTPVSRRVAGNIRVHATPDYSDVRIAIGAPTPYLVEELDDAYRLTLYNTTANSDNINYLSVRDPVVRRIDSRQETTDRAVYTIATTHAPYGYMVFHDGSTMVLRLRRQPAVDGRHPLRGLTIVVDPGHPPGGATGPTGLWEPEAVLGVGRQLQRILTERGATVVMTRTTMDPVALGDRPVMTRKANGHAFVSLHLDALPDGANPFVLQGTGTYFFRMHSEPLARAVQAGMVRQMGIRDRGVYSANFAVIRNTWVPAVLTEGGFLMIPEQEAAFRDPRFQERYARGVADGLEAYFRSLVSP